MSVSVIIPNFNGEKYLEETILSILNQSYKPYEIILIDDCSSDNSLEIVNKYENIRIFKNKRNMGIGYTRQRGLDVANGDYISFLSSDDCYHKKFLEKTLINPNQIVGIYTDYYFCNSFLSPINIFRSINYSRDNVIDWALNKNMFINFSSILIPNRYELLFEKKLRVGEDIIFLLDSLINNCYDWLRLPEPLLYYRIHKEQNTNKLKIEDFILTWKYIKDRLIKLDIDEDYINNKIRLSFMNRYNIKKRIINKIKKMWI